jgi:membrane protease YdiL (CAAX protease family)
MSLSVSLRDRLRAFAVSAGIAVVGFLVAIPLFFVVLGGAALLGFGFSLSELFLLSVLLLQGIAFPLTAFTYLRSQNLSLPFLNLRRPTVRDSLWVVGGYVLTFVLVIVCLIIVASIDAPTAERSNQAAFQDPQTLLWLIPLSFLVIGPGEELLFRGVIQSRLRRSFSPTSGIVLASAMFAPPHVLSLSGSIYALALTIAILFIPSLVFGATYELSENLLVPIVIHGAYDATIFGIVYLTVRYSGAQSAIISDFAYMI